MPDRFESDSYNVVIARENFSIKLLKALVIVGKGECLVKNFAFSGLDKTVVFILVDINTDQKHSKTFNLNLMLRFTKLFALNPRAR